MTDRGLWIPQGYFSANKSVLLSKRLTVNILVYEYLNVKWFNLPQWNETFHDKVPEEKLISLNIPAWDKARALQGTDKSDPASTQKVWKKNP